ncbi:unnamed protein product, partial [Brenthis ino]
MMSKLFYCIILGSSRSACSPMTGQNGSALLKNSGPDHHRSESRRLLALVPRDIKSAGLQAVGTWRQFSG